MSSINAVIVDDEFFNRSLIHTLISRINVNFNIVAQAENVKEGYKLINRTRPDVVFLDIKMQDGSGFDLLRKFDKINFEVVFVTGFDEYALKAFQFNAIDYVLKPIDTDKFAETLGRVEERVNKKQLSTININQILLAYNNSVITKIPVQHNGEIILLNTQDIICIVEKERSTQFKVFPATTYISSKQLVDFEFIICDFHNFIRINDTTYLNINFIESYTRGLGTFITMKDGSIIEVTRRKKAEIVDKLKAIKHGLASKKQTGDYN